MKRSLAPSQLGAAKKFKPLHPSLSSSSSEKAKTKTEKQEQAQASMDTEVTQPIKKENVEKENIKQNESKEVSKRICRNPASQIYADNFFSPQLHHL